MNEITPQGNRAHSLKTLTAVNYGLYALSFLIGISAVIAIIINYVKLDDVRNTWLESHFRWQMRTFWFGLLWVVIGFILLIIFIGWVVLAAAAIWVIYRLVKGFLNLNDGKSMYQDLAPK